jgi:hypothetical protein
MNTLPDRSVTHVGKLYCHLCTEVQQLIDQSALKAMPIYNWIKRQPMEKQSLHNIRLRFESAGLWDIYSKMNTTFVVNPYNKDIILPTSVYFDYLEVVVTIHHTDTVSVAISCSFKPIANISE